MPLSALQAKAVTLHRELDELLGRGSTPQFTSGYRTVHPYIGRYTAWGSNGSVVGSALGDYRFPNDQNELMETIREFHRTVDGVDYSPDEILVSSGSSPLIMTLMLWMQSRSVKRLHYLRSLYHSFYHFADLLGLEFVPLGDEPCWTMDADLVLPTSASTLVLTDPIWFAGRTVSRRAIKTIAEWQRATGSIVVVDGTFQYLNWKGTFERSSRLCRRQTLRLVSPTKALGLHGIRFAYLLGPADLLAELRWTCDTVSGAGSSSDLFAATSMMKVLVAPTGNQALREYIARRYLDLRSSGILSDVVVEPDCCYYVFGRLAVTPEMDRGPKMGSAYFDLSGFSGMKRINLLSPALAAILER
jgi:aspartate/methionine/tyrosine aminotransferase